MLIQKKYKVRHKILAVLREQMIPYDNTLEFNLYDAQITLKQLSTLSKLPEYKILEQIDYLLNSKEVSCDWIDNEARYLIETRGNIALSDDKYLAAGREYTFRWFKEIVTTISVIIAIIVTVFTFLSNYLNTLNNAKAIEDIKKDMRLLREEQKKPLQKVK